MCSPRGGKCASRNNPAAVLSSIGKFIGRAAPYQSSCSSFSLPLPTPPKNPSPQPLLDFLFFSGFLVMAGAMAWVQQDLPACSKCIQLGSFDCLSDPALFDCVREDYSPFHLQKVAQILYSFTACTNCLQVWLRLQPGTWTWHCSCSLASRHLLKALILPGTEMLFYLMGTVF